MLKRLDKVKRVLTQKKLDAILVSSVVSITYLTGFSSFSKDEREAYLLITKTKQYIITDGRYSEAVAIHVPHFELVERTVTNSLDAIFKSLKKKHHIKKLGIEEDDITVSEYKSILACFNDLNHFSVSYFRSVKELNEINAIKKACRIGDKTFDYILTKLKKGVSEKEIATNIEFFIKKQGADISFPPIVAFGANSSVPHHQTSDKRLTRSTSSGQAAIILLDFGVKLDNYCSDMTRTVFFGKATNEQKRIYQTVLGAQKKALEALTSDGGRPKRSEGHDSSEVESKGNGLPRGGEIKAKDIDGVARDYIISQGYPTIPHSLGHGIGLEVHEQPHLSPKSKDKFVPGMVFSIEPGVYLPGFGGARIEDLVVLEPAGLPRRQAGPRLLTHSPKDIIEL